MDIHEILLVFFTFMALASAWRYWRARKIGWALLAGAGAGLMHATKETFVITVAAAALALAFNWIWDRWLDASGPPIKAPDLNWKHVAAALGVWITVWLVLFSSFFRNASGGGTDRRPITRNVPIFAGGEDRAGEADDENEGCEDAIPRVDRHDAGGGGDVHAAPHHHEFRKQNAEESEDEEMV
jgi:hypothetical protein